MTVVRKSWFKALSDHDISAIRKLLTKGADPNWADEFGCPSLFYAVAPAGGNLELVKLLVNAGADISVRDREGNDFLDYGNCYTSGSNENLDMLKIKEYIASISKTPGK